MCHEYKILQLKKFWQTKQFILPSPDTKTRVLISDTPRCKNHCDTPPPPSTSTSFGIRGLNYSPDRGDCRYIWFSLFSQKMTIWVYKVNRMICVGGRRWCMEKFSRPWGRVRTTGRPAGRPADLRSLFPSQFPFQVPSQFPSQVLYPPFTLWKWVIGRFSNKEWAPWGRCSWKWLFSNKETRCAW